MQGRADSIARAPCTAAAASCSPRPPSKRRSASGRRSARAPRSRPRRRRARPRRRASPSSRRACASAARRARAAVAAAPAAPAAPAARSPEEQERDEAVADYLGTKPYWGRSAFANLDQVRELCGPEGERAYDRTRKLWGTRVLAHLRRLLQSRLWEPVGVPEEWWPALLEAADAKIDAEMRRAEAIAQERRERLLEEQAHRDRAAARRARQEAERIEREAEAAREAERAAERELLRQKSERARSTEPPTDDEVAACHALGVEEATIEASHVWPELGPTSGLSTEARLLRWIDICLHGVDVEHEFTPTSRDQAAMDVLRAACKRETVARLNERARGG